MADVGETLESEAILIDVTNFGVCPNSFSDQTKAIQAVIHYAIQMNLPTIVHFPAGLYELHAKSSTRAFYSISNTVSETDHSDLVKHIGIHIVQASQLTIEATDAKFIVYGKMTPIVIDRSDHITITGLTIDYKRPTISEMTVVGPGDNYIDVSIHSDSRYEINNNSLVWIGDHWSHTDGAVQQYNPKNNTTWRIANPLLTTTRIEVLTEQSAHAHQRGTDQLRLYYETDQVPSFTIGHTIQMRDGIRDEVGSFIVNSSNVVWDKVTMHYMHGLGIVGQFCENLSFTQLKLAPEENSGRTAAAFADFMHFSANKGKISIVDCYFEGAHDDVINVHGTHLQIISCSNEGKQIHVRYMHGQSYGFQPYYAGDEIAFIAASSLTEYGRSVVRYVEQLSPREYCIELEQAIPPEWKIEDVIENVTWTPEVLIQGNTFKRIPTRGVLVSTRKKVEILNNTFDQMYMSAILIANDAKSWYESGMVTNVRIAHNRFVACGSPRHSVILIYPENEDVAVHRPVHRHIVIANNQFIQATSSMLEAKSTADIQFYNNEVIVQKNQQADENTTSDLMGGLVKLWACSDVKMENNSWDQQLDKVILAREMPMINITVEEDWTIVPL
ncbi:right-handed parallel beta-helix repeat-containing protein [Paenibacillus yanchengensis]|uniref:Right-handed parallel beta-helix repeat-containing protein n=1 Tax=Paenibacillus yanchengensis TaxID=2035833 RepID=A0ABW4YGV3_9BACL